MSFLLGFLGAIIGIIVIILIIALVIYSYVRKTVGKTRVKELVQVAKQAKSIKQQEYTRVKNVSGMTKLFEPQIIRDFPDFNKELLFSKLESNLIKILTAIEEKSTSKIVKDEDLELIYSNLEEKINVLQENNQNLKYDDIIFHNHAIKQYIRSSGIATITTSSTVEYYYKDSIKEDEFSNLKKQTRYTCNFIYVYDENKVGKNQKVFTINCPNCGAPLKILGNHSCEYCSSHIEPINLKIWKMSSYKEDYK